MEIALLGLGTVGGSFYRIIQEYGNVIAGKKVNIKYVLVRNKANKRIDENILTTNFDDIINDGSIDIVVEAMGASVSYNYIKRALENGKSVITANKEVIALYIDELTNIANKNNCQLLYEASVGGSIPIINALLNASKFNKINKIEGILNGTTNFILTNMQQNKLSFQESLKLAQEKGFAEADPTADLEGLDMVRKIAILSSIAYKCKVDIKNVHHYGIKNVSSEIIEVVDLLGYKLKFLASSVLDDNKIGISVEPVMIKKDEMLANVDYEFNVVKYQGENSDIQLMYGKGAGYATANSLLNDLVLLLSGNHVSFIEENQYEIIGNSNDKATYLLMLKEKNDFSFILKDLGDFVITKEISGNTLNEVLPKVGFYAKMI